MLPGYVHFDLRYGLKADMLNAAISQFLSSAHMQSIRNAFDAMGLEEITWELIDDAAGGLKGRLLQFYFANTHIKANISAPKSQACLIKKSALWNGDRAPAFELAKPELLLSKNMLLQACLNGEHISLEQLRQPFLSPKAPLEIAGVALEIINNLECDAFVEQKLAGFDALWLLCHLTMLAAALAALDPKFLSASKIYISAQQAFKLNSVLELNNQSWLRHILQSLPVTEVDEALEIDVLAAAFVKTLVAHFGARGDSVILALGRGLCAHTKVFCEALWCEANLPETMSEIGPSNKARAYFISEVCGHVAATHNMSCLSASMSLHGAKALSYSLIHGERNSSAYLMRFLVQSDRQKEALEAFLIKANARHVTVKAIELHELNRRLVSVPLGKGNKSEAYRFYEYIYYDRCVRVEAHPEDLDIYVRQTNYSVDVARSDLLMAWKKWREHVIEPS